MRADVVDNRGHVIHHDIPLEMAHAIALWLNLRNYVGYKFGVVEL